MEGRKVTQAEFSRIVREPWCNTKVNQATGEKKKLSGQNKEEHGLGRVNDRLFFHLCNVPIVKVSQHLVRNKHQAVHESRKKRRINKNDLNPSVYSEATISAARQESTNI